MAMNWQRGRGALLLMVLAAGLLTAGGGASGSEIRTAVFAGGCFWCMEKPFDDLDGVFDTEVGYAGGHVANPTYQQVVTGTTGHIEVVRVHFDPAVVSYGELLDVFWRNVDPLDGDGQFCDRGSPYRSAIFPGSEAQRTRAQASLESIGSAPGLAGAAIATRILPLDAFYRAEDYHQDYYLKNPLRYRFYRVSCQRDERLRALWGD